MGGFPAQFAPYPRGVDGVAAVVAGPVLDESYQVGIFTALEGGIAGGGPDQFEFPADGLYDVDILFLAVAADIIGLARAAFSQYVPYGPAVVADIEPVPHVQPVAVYRQGLAREGVQDKQGDSFSG